MGHIVAILLLCSTLYRIFTCHKGEMASNAFDIMDYIVAFLSLFGIVILSMLIRRNGILEFLGRNTLVILAIHICVIDYSCIFIEPLISNHLFFKIIQQVLIWGASIIMFYLTNKFLPWAVGK